MRPTRRSSRWDVSHEYRDNVKTEVKTEDSSERLTVSFKFHEDKMKRKASMLQKAHRDLAAAQCQLWKLQKEVSRGVTGVLVFLLHCLDYLALDEYPFRRNHQWICMKYRIIILIIIIISLGKISLPYIANTSRTHACTHARAHTRTLANTHTPTPRPSLFAVSVRRTMTPWLGAPFRRWRDNGRSVIH